MFPLIESLKLKDGFISNLDYHQSRMDRSLEELFPNSEKIILEREIHIPENCKTGFFKIRIQYGPVIETVEFESYVFRTIQSLKVVHHDSIDYHLKYSNRQILLQLYAQRETCDDIILVKNGFVTDSFAANLLFFNGEQWLTPTTPLLKGTKRQFLLDQGKIFEREIREEDLHGFQKVGLINALIDLEDMPEVPVEQIFF